MSQEIFIQTPTRIDFAGGTLDIPPLFLFHQPCYTVNAAIDIYATAKIREASPEVPFSWKLISQDLGESVALNESSKNMDFAEHPLELPIRFLLEHGKGSGVMEISSGAPKGSGLGASSSLGIAIQGALDKLRGEEKKDMERIEYVKGIETQTIRVPTGYQDYLAAFYKGVNVFSFSLGGIQQEPIKGGSFLKALEQHLFLVYTTPHFSGMNNRELFKRHIDQDPRIVGFFERLRENAERCRQAFLEENISAIAKIMTQDWEDRKAMIPTMSTPTIEEVIDRLQDVGALGWRVCGAGGGGCVAFLLSPENHEIAKERLKGLLEVQILPCQIVT